MENTIYHSFKSLIDSYKGGIEIPILQRDYAQGRNNRQNVRSEFLDKLLECLNSKSDEDNSTLVLDFIYGYSENERFIPLDGQQRLTTLFLLHYYCVIEQSDNFFLNRQVLTYNTRLSSQKFCSELMKVSSKLKRNGKFIEQIKDASWFSNSWLKDPTVKGMLVMFDDIDKRLHDKELSQYWNRLTEDECIKFLIKNINDKDNQIKSDNLYIKMNARGKSLSEYENFKSFIDGIVQKECNEVYEEWISQIDHLWTDLFWRSRNTTDKNPEEIGDEFMRFFKGILYDKLVLMGEKQFIDALPEIFDDSIINFFNLYDKTETKENQCKRIYAELVKKIANDELIHNLIYKNLNLFDSQLIYRIKDILNVLSVSLADIIEKTKTLTFNISNQQTDNDKPFERNLFQGVITGRVTFQNRLLFYALCEILLRKDSLNETFEKLRIIRNLIENRAYNNVTDYSGGLAEIKKIIDYDNVLMSIADDSNIITHFEKVQIEEERNKARILISNAGGSWKNLINEAENNDYLLGQISYLFKFAEIEDYSNPTNESLISFDNYYKISSKIFEYNKENNSSFILQRALLCFGDYSLKYNVNSKRFGLLTTNKERDTTFKKLLVDDNCLIFKQLLDCIDLEKTIENNLNSFIQNHDSRISDFRKELIENEHLIKSIGNYKLFEYSNKNNGIVYLVTGRNNGWYIGESRSLSLYYSIINGEFSNKVDREKWNIRYFHVTDHNVYPCVVFDFKSEVEKFAIDIHFDNFENIGLKYRISIFSRFDNIDAAINETVLMEKFGDKLDKFEWIANTESSYFRFEKFYDTESNCINDLLMLTGI